MLNSESLKCNISSFKDFYNLYEESLKLIIFLNQEGNIIFEDLLLNEKEIINGVNNQNFKEKIYEDDKLDHDQRSLIIISLSKISKNFNGLLHDENITELSQDKPVNVFSGIHLAYVNDLNVFSFYAEEYQNYKLNIHNENCNKRDFILNIYDRHSYNMFLLYQNQITLIALFERSSNYFVCDSTDLSYFAGFERKFKEKILDELFKDLLELHKNFPAVFPQRIKAIPQVVTNGFEYRLNISGNQYRIYYQKKDNNIYILMDYHKQTSVIPEYIKKRIRKIKSEFKQ